MLPPLVIACVLLATADANPIYLKYVKEREKLHGCGHVTPGLVSTVANLHFPSNLTVIIFDELYYIDINFKWILDEIVKNLRYSAVMFGRNRSLFDKPRGNERPSWVVFSSQMDALPGRTLLISHNSPFQVKEWLITPMAKRFMDILAVSDPSLMRPGGGDRECDVGLFTHSFNDEVLGGAAASLVTSWRGNGFAREVRLFPDKFGMGYKGMHLTVALSEFPPFAFRRDRIHGSDVGEYWDGIEVRLIHHLSEALNFTYELKDISIHAPGKEIPEVLLEKHADLGIGRQVATVQLYNRIVLSYPHSDDCAAFVSLTSTALPKYRAIMGPFLWDVWLALTAIYIFAVIPFAFSAWHTLRPLVEHPAKIEEMFWYVFGTFTNLFTFSGKASWTRGVKSSTKLFIGTYWVFTIIVTACYTGSIIAFITLPDYPDVVDTMHQLLHGNFKVVTTVKDGWWDLLTDSNDDDASGLAGTAETVDDYYEGIVAVVDNAKEDKPYTFFGSKDHLTFIIKMNYTNSKVGKRQMFHISKQCFVTQMISIGLPPGSLHAETLNYAVIRAAESGLITKIYKDLEWEIYKSSVRSLLQGSMGLKVMERELTLDDTQGMFLLLGIGFGMAGVAWVLEVGSWAKGRDLWALGKESSMGTFRRVSHAFLAPSRSYTRHHYPLYFRSEVRRRSSLFGSRVNDRPPAFSQIHLKPNIEKPIRLLSF